MKDFGSPETWNIKVDEFLEKKSQASLIEDLAPGPLRDEYLKDFDPTQETYEEYKRRKSIPMEDRPFNMAEGGVIGPGGMFRGEDLGTREGFKGLRQDLQNNPELLDKFKQDVANNSRVDIRRMYGKNGVPLSDAILARILKDFNIKKFGKIAPKGLDKIKPEVTKNANKILKILKNDPTISMIDLFRKSNLTENQFTSAGYALKTNRVIDNKQRFDIPKNIADRIKKLGAVTSVEQDLVEKNILKPKEIKTLFTDPRKAISEFFTKGTMFEHTFPKTLIPYIKGKDNRKMLEITGTRTSPFLNYFKQRYDNLQRGAVNKFLQDGDLNSYNKTINDIRDIVRKATGGYEIGYIKFDKNKKPTAVVNAKPVTEGFKQFGVETNQRMSAFKNAKYSSNLLKNYFKNPNSEIFNSLRKDFPVENIPEEAVKDLDLAAKGYDKAKPFLGNISKFTNFAKNNLANPLVKALFKTSYGKAALVGGAALSPGMLAADEPGTEVAKETSLMDEIIGPKGAAAGATLLTKPGRALAGNLLRTLAYLDTPLVGGAFTAASIGDLKKDIEKGKQTDVSALELTGPAAFSHLTAQELGLYNKKTGIKKLFDTILRGGGSRVMAQRILPVLAKGSTYATPLVELGIQTYNAKQRLEEAKEKYGTDDMVPTAMGMAPKQYVEELASELPDIDRTGAMGGGIMRINLKNGPDDPSKRKFMKLGLGIASLLPFGIGRLAKKPAVQKAVENAPVVAEQGWSWVKDNFWTIYNTVNKKAKDVTRLRDGDLKKYQDVEVIDGPESVRVRYKTDNGNNAETVYTKPYKEVNPETGEVIDVPGQFEEYQDVYRMSSDGNDYYKDFEEEIIDSVDNVKKIIKED